MLGYKKNRKAMNALLSTALVTMMVFVAISIVINFSNPLIAKGSSLQSIKDGENVMSYLDNYVQEVAKDGKGASRSFGFSTTAKDYTVLAGEDSIRLKYDAPFEVLEYFSRQKNGNKMTIAGSDVTCNQSGSQLLMENTHLLVAFQKVGSSSSPATIDTANNIANITQKDLGKTFTPSNSSVILDNDPTTRTGTGYSEIMNSGKSLPMCVAHFYVNSTNVAHYDVYYILYAGADFLEVRVDNIKY